MTQVAEKCNIVVLRGRMSSETTVGWTSGDASMSSWNVTDLHAGLLENNSSTVSVSTDNRTLTAGGSANAILAEETIKIIYLVIGELRTCIAYTFTLHVHV